MNNKISVTAVQQDTHIVYVCDETKQPYVDLAQLEKMLPGVANVTLRNRLSEMQDGLVKTATIRSHTREYEVQLYPACVVFKLAFEFDLALR